MPAGVVQGGQAGLVRQSGARAGGEQGPHGRDVGTRTADVGHQRRAAPGRGAVGVDAPGEPLGHQVGIPALGGQPEELLEAPAMFRALREAAKIVHEDDCTSRGGP